MSLAKTQTCTTRTIIICFVSCISCVNGQNLNKHVINANKTWNPHYYNSIENIVVIGIVYYITSC